MKSIIKLFGALLVAAGIVLIFKPALVYDLVENNMDNKLMLSVGILVRLLIGFLLIKTALESRHPKFVRVLGIVFIIAAAILASSILLIDGGKFQEGLRAIIDFVKPYSLLASLMSFILGGYLIYVYTGMKEA